ncbi:putative drug/proton antiporter YHK8 [Hypsizygus marmoreus]|uniref:Drug/proton antiporter YHK8 n=1 Tax=Hypsizygus marmoreus TaxID=39966 RepID=A0A369JBF0_HYPMA|nr:putative drug/proton antiporter YHK8 [Hypsizygus marmoreus]
MATEATPLLTPTPSEIGRDDEAIYERFSRRKKLMILSMVSWCGLLPLFITGSFVPLVPQIAEDLSSTGSVISLAVFAAGLGSLSGGSYSTYYGRRPVYLYGLSLSAAGSMGMALSKSVPTFMFCRFCQTFGASPAMTVGAGVIGDIYAREQRGTAMGVFLGAILLGPTLAPLVGGLAAHYATWRIMQLALCSSGLVALAVMVLFFPETTHPGTRGIDKVRLDSVGTKTTSGFKFINPLQALWLLQSPVVLGVISGKRYNIPNEALLGACFLPNGLGDIGTYLFPSSSVTYKYFTVGAPLAGLISDRILRESREKRGGIWCPEDRIRGTLMSAATLVPISVLSFGILNKFLPNTVGLVLTLVCLFVNGAGVQMVLGPTAAYLIDIMPSRSAETVAASTGFRSWMLAIVLSGALPLINSIGVAPTYALCAVLAWIGAAMLWGIVRYGDRLRAWNDLGFAKAPSH